MSHVNEEFDAIIIARDSIEKIDFNRDTEDLSIMVVTFKNGKESKYLIRCEWIKSILNQIETKQFITIEAKTN